MEPDETEHEITVEDVFAELPLITREDQLRIFALDHAAALAAALGMSVDNVVGAAEKFYAFLNSASS